MPSSTVGQSPSLATFLKSLKQNNTETSIALFVDLLKRRQIKNSRPCALATAHLLLRVVASERIRDPQKLIERVRQVGRKLVSAQPRELAVGNVVRRVLGVIREVAEDDEGSAGSSEVSSEAPAGGQPLKRPMLHPTMSEFSPLHNAAALPEDLQTTIRGSPSETPPPSAGDDGRTSQQRPPLLSSHPSTTAPAMTSLFNILQHPSGRSPAGTPPTGTQSPSTSTPPRQQKPRPSPLEPAGEKEKIDVKAEVIDGIKELLDELTIVDSQIAETALDHIHSNEIILTHTSSQTVQKFLLAAAKKRKFTLIHAEAYPNNHLATHCTIVNGGGTSADDDDGERWKPLTEAGVTVILIPDTAAFALMSRVNKVILAPHAVLANGSLLAAAGAATIARAARTHHVPVVVLSGVYKLSPVYPFDTHELIEHGDPSKVVGWEEAEFRERVEVVNPIFDFVEAEDVGLYVTNLGACAPSFLYRIVADHYRVEDVDLSR